MKKTVALAVAIVFVLAFAVPVFAQSMTHNASYKMDGSIDIEKQVGHLCNTGAELKQTIKGEGEMTKVMDTAQVAGVITVSDQNDWVTAVDAVRNLTVTSAIELCAPPKMEFDKTKHVYNDDDGWDSAVRHSGVVSPWDMYAGGITSDRGLVDWLIAEGLVDNINQVMAMPDDEWEALIEGLDEYWTLDVAGLTDQIWAVQVSADPGFSGNLHQDFEAAYGPYGTVLGADDDVPAFVPSAPVNHWLGLGNFAGSGFWYIQPDDDGLWGVTAGDDYVGNYFNIDQMARTSMGTTRRYISISSPWSHGYLTEDMEVVGMAEVEESFAMANLAPGAEAIPDWWKLF